MRSLLSRNHLRIAFVVLVLLSSVVLANGATGDHLTTASEEDVPRAPATDGHTVITESGKTGTITAYAPDGSVIYYDNSRTKYYDVDPVEGDPMTIEYTATDTINSQGVTCSDPPCSLNVIERVDLETGEKEVIYERYDASDYSSEWHDADRIDENRILVGDMVEDRMFIVNTETEIVEWSWDVQSAYPIEGGGPFPRDWAHLNDVEYIESEGDPMNGTMMASLRNQDQVVFVDPEEGLQENWTLGSENNHDIMFEQHNPDYIPEENGGPAITVADSENARVQEFQREDGEWTRSWEWSDDRMQWPRDVDRLPDGNTLITDTHGHRVMEVNPAGEIVWAVESSRPYEAERLETGAESTNGQSARELGLESRTPGDFNEDDSGASADSAASGFDPIGTLAGLFGELAATVISYFSFRLYNALIFITPIWMGNPEFGAAGVLILTLLVWGVLEFGWRLYDSRLTVRNPIQWGGSGK
ncbi:hypothetical protein HacjB3_02910 [Halalkalicoccus jeotgali B3]|uniref:Arylsulfotransferase (Asst) n=1 Tax=Halalkalicoccus jeotgali (strain DSM 18796 / CECT 7217 / JCM 14584 / KCTC 4019 / B3) TaxID=795797 RepID=D8J780_HALJB|nr:hypothetical protein HacjB3_02910 [Halalkalicoccus jeotgali B3]